MEKKYTVFVSSTYEDLIKERQEVMHALLEIDCIPCGMELFPADDDEQFDFIKDIIDDCDYYILILAGRYGSKNKDGISYTELEFRYAMDRGIPIISFLHKDINLIASGKCEKSVSSKKKLQEFRTLAQKKLCKYWETADELSGIVSRSMIQMIKRHPAVGWVRANQISTEESLEKIVQLYEENTELKGTINDLTQMTKYLDQGNKTTNIVFKVFVFNKKNNNSHEIDHFSISLTWNELLEKFGPILISESNYSYIKRLFQEFGEEYYIEFINNKEPLREDLYISIDAYSFGNVITHFMALGYIEIHNPTPTNDCFAINESYYMLTEQGRTALFQITANKSCMEEN